MTLKSLIGILILFCAPTLVKTDEGFVFKIVQRENTLYRTRTQTASINDLSIEADEVVLKELRSKGVIFPMHISQNQTIVILSETGSMSSTGSIPFSGRVDSAALIQYTNGELQSNSGNGPLDTTFRMWGNYNNGSIDIDSINGRNVDPTLATMVNGVMGQMMQSIKFPDSPMKLGDNFTQTVPLTVPIPGLAPVEFTITTVYTLLDHDSGIAHFNLLQEYNLSSISDSSTITIEGKGGGTMTYDGSLQQMTCMKTNSSLNMRMRVELLTMIVKGTSSSEMSISIHQKK